MRASLANSEPRADGKHRALLSSEVYRVRQNILGIDAFDIQVQKDRWLAENPHVRITEIGDIKREPPSLLVRFGGRRVPRFSMHLRYREEHEPQKTRL
jgi:hypothetical protein